MGQFFSYILKQVHFAQGVIIPCYPLFIFFSLLSNPVFFSSHIKICIVQVILIQINEPSIQVR